MAQVRSFSLNSILAMAGLLSAFGVAACGVEASETSGNSGSDSGASTGGSNSSAGGSGTSTAGTGTGGTSTGTGGSGDTGGSGGAGGSGTGGTASSTIQPDPNNPVADGKFGGNCDSDADCLVEDTCCTNDNKTCGFILMGACERATDMGMELGAVNDPDCDRTALSPGCCMSTGVCGNFDAERETCSERLSGSMCTP